MHYNSPAKDHWRHWQWRRIDEKLLALRPRPRRNDCLVLYLVGPKDNDRLLAQDYGFKDYNLIAIDRDQECIDRVRAAGHIGICAQLSDVLLLWPKDWPIDVIVADYVCGLDKQILLYLFDVLDFSRAIQPGQTIISTNWQHGRDPTTNDWRAGLGEWGQLMLKVFWADETLRLAFADVEKNRAKAFIVSYFYHFWDACMHRLLPGQPIPPDFPPGWPVNWRWADVLTQFFASLDPSFFSYRQARASPYMDTVVFKPYPCIKQISHEQTVRCFLAKHEGGHGPLPPEEVLDGLRPLATKVMRKIAEARIEHDRKRAKA